MVAESKLEMARRHGLPYWVQKYLASLDGGGDAHWGVPSMAAESKLEKDLRQYALSRGCLLVKLRAIGKRGFPDNMLLTPGGRVPFWEIKSPTGRVEPGQRHWHTLLRGFNVQVHVISDLDEGKRLIDLALCPGG